MQRMNVQEVNNKMKNERINMMMKVNQIKIVDKIPS